VLSQTTEYALRAIVYLASAEGAPKTAQQVAEGTVVPARYMSKVLQSLGRAGLLNAQRGLRGGFVLARPSSKITLLEVVAAIEPIRRIEKCPLGLPSHVKLCPLHRRMDEAIAEFEKTFGSTTVDQLLTEKASSRPLCDAITVDGPRIKVTSKKKAATA
jgi:Rrf2 family protein